MTFPLVLQATDLADAIALRTKPDSTPNQAGICLVDLRSSENYEAAHIPGAVRGDITLLNHSEPPVGGMLPSSDQVNRFLAEVGADDGDHIIAYDGGLETAAARLIWVLDAYGYEANSWLNGGFKTWNELKLPTSQTTEIASPGDLRLARVAHNLISADDLIHRLEKDDVTTFDVRSRAEYEGTDIRSRFGGHVPGAFHLEWTQLLDTHGQLHNDETLRKLFENAPDDTEDTVIVYCQTHQRSAVTYVALKHLGYADIKAIDGAWSNWGNRDDTPKESTG
jgi:thiosulfate/3-mercaptopyruvate sulfurtransferase